jgi:ribosomal protein S18 acetylase RimI-like enzyme
MSDADFRSGSLWTMQCQLYAEEHLPGILGLCDAEGWTSFLDDHERTRRVLTAPGVTTVVATDHGRVVGFAYIQSDGEIQAHLSLIAVEQGHRRRGIARELLQLALDTAGGQRIDLISDTAEAFYRSLTHVAWSGFRIYPPFTAR